MRDLDAAFTALNRQVGTAVRPPAPGEIIHRARRRRTTRAVLAGIVAIAVVGTGAAFLAAPRHESAPPAKPTPTISESPSPPPTSSPSSPPATSSSRPPAATQQPLQRIPNGLLLHGDDFAADPLDEYGEGWKRDQRTAQPWLYAPCGDESLPGDRSRADAESLRNIGPSENEYGEQVVAYRTIATAEQVMNAWRNAYRGDGCTPAKAVHQSTRMPIGDEALRVAYLERRATGAAGEWIGLARYGVVVRVANVVFLYYHQETDGEGTLNDREFTVPERDARRMVGRLCEVVRCDN